jgi:glutamyl-tRNA synthetase
MSYVGRLAPSPTGALHLGNVRTFMVAWLRARSQGGKMVFRMEDLDHPKDKPGAAAAAVEDLKWLGFDWDEEYTQSERKEIYRNALNYLRGQEIGSMGGMGAGEMGAMGAVGGMGAEGSISTVTISTHSTISTYSTHSTNAISPLVYPCICTRKDVESAQSAPHAGEQLHYPGACRGRFASWAEAFAFKGAAPCWRFVVPEGTCVKFHDAFAGDYEQDVAATLGDFPLARDEGGAGYTLACTVDDLLMGVTEVVRGDDLLAATPAQILLAQTLREWQPPQSVHCSLFSVPCYLHLPLVVGPDGKRLAKRHGDTRVATFRERGWTPERLLGLLAASCGWAAPGECVTLRDLLPRFTLATIPRAPVCLADALAAS